MSLLSSITLKWYSEDELLKENPRELIDLFLNSIGVSRKIAGDVFEVLLISRMKNLPLTAEEIRKEVIELRKKRKEIGIFDGNVEESASKRNIQVWIKFFKDIKMIESVKNKYIFSGNKFPSEVFETYTKPLIIDESVKFISNVLKKIEEKYNIQEFSSK